MNIEPLLYDKNNTIGSKFTSMQLTINSKFREVNTKIECLEFEIHKLKQKKCCIIS